ncbi:RICIN domain-containing protein [Streptomyces pseudovenezuelae]|uniref:RICIN domain-containing protein n=1 Tax=Streptomyces pseudovenezuelae TaxID=67350 RepID=UPI00371A46B3
MTGDAAMSTAPLSMTMELTMPDQRAKGPLNIRFAGKAMYVGGGALDIRKLGRSAKLDPDKLNGKSRLRIEPATWGLISVDNRSYGILPHQAEGSPIVQSTLLTGAKNAKKIGAETILGARTTHYPCNGGDWQKWRVHVFGDGTRRLQNVATGYCLVNNQLEAPRSM